MGATYFQIFILPTTRTTKNKLLLFLTVQFYKQQPQKQIFGYKNKIERKGEREEQQNRKEKEKQRKEPEK